MTTFLKKNKFMHVFSICLPLHTDTLSCMNTVIYMNNKKYFAQNNIPLDFSYVRLKMAGVDNDDSDDVT